MKENSVEFKFCPRCGSTDYLENYPALGTSTCGECGHEVISIALNVIHEEDEETALRFSVCYWRPPNSVGYVFEPTYFQVWVTKGDQKT